MHEPSLLLQASDFPAIVRARLETAQVNLSYRCNQACSQSSIRALKKLN